jgi:hypothetical protein
LRVLTQCLPKSARVTDAFKVPKRLYEKENICSKMPERFWTATQDILLSGAIVSVPKLVLVTNCPKFLENLGLLKS